MKTLILSIVLAAGLGVAPAIASAQPVNGIPVDGGAVKKPVRGLKPVKVRGLSKGIPVDGGLKAHPTATLSKPALVNGIPVDNGGLTNHRPVTGTVPGKPVLTKGIPVDPHVGAVQH